jgi:phosphotransferase system HPr-like phosphotransfer protein
MPDTQAQALERVIEEQQFLAILQEECDEFCSLVGTLLSLADSIWYKKHYFQLLSRFEVFETLLDDHGARHNRTFSFLRELTASIRGVAYAGYSMSHMAARLDTYQVLESLDLSHYHELEGHVANVRGFIQASVVSLLGGLQDEMHSLGVQPERRHVGDDEFMAPQVRQRLPHNIGEEEPGDERARIGEVASKFLLASDLFAGHGLRRIDDPDKRHEYLSCHFREEQARVFEATVHNLQSSYDTYVKNTGIESDDPRLAQLRGLASTALHMLETATSLIHFCERHEGDIHRKDAERRLNELVSRSGVEERALHHLLLPAMKVMTNGRALAKQILGAYTTTQELTLDLQDGINLHARPAALIVGIVGHYGTPVELEVKGERCNAGSILELLVCVGTHPEERCFVFHGDEAPLADIAALFEYGLGEQGLDALPSRLDYLVDH